jgi:hypothetical protein
LADSTKIQYCSATGNLTGFARVGGIVGAVYSDEDGNVNIDNDSYVGGTIAVNSTRNAYSGGIVGYSQGWISDSYAYGITLNSVNGGHYLAGAAGLLQGNSPTASIYNSYAVVSSYLGTDPTYDMPFMASLDGSSILPVYDCVWVETNAAYTQPEPPQAGWGFWSPNTGAVLATDLNSTPTVNILNSSIPGTFLVGSTYPILAWQGSAGRVYVDPVAGIAGRTPGSTPSYTPNTDTTAIFVDGTVAGSGTGTKTDPFNTIDLAIDATSAWAGSRVIYISNLVTISTTDTWTLPTGWIIQRSSEYPGYLFNVNMPQGASVHLSVDCVVDGNSTRFTSATNSLFYVASGSVDITTNGVLRNNYAGDGGAVQVFGGNLNLLGGSISGNKAAINGGGVTVLNAGTFVMNSGSISGNTAANNGGGVSVFNGSQFTVTGGTISGNTARAGNGIYIGGLVGTTAVTFTVTPGSGTFNLADTIYLSDGTQIYVSATLVNITGSLIIQSENTTSGYVVVTCSTQGIANSGFNAGKFTYVDSSHTLQRNLATIYIV